MNTDSSGFAAAGSAVGGVVGGYLGNMVCAPCAIAGRALGSAVGSAIQDKFCPPEKPCPPCKMVISQTVAVGTIGYRLDRVPPGRPHKPYEGDQYNSYKAHQMPSPRCDRFWQPISAADAENGAPPNGAIPIEPFAK